MVIEKNGNTYILQCDYCSNYIDDLEDFQEVVDYKKANGWKSEKIGQDWLNKCPNCQESGGKGK